MKSIGMSGYGRQLEMSVYVVEINLPSMFYEQRIPILIFVRSRSGWLYSVE
jgi:hypothetical protein